MLGKDAEHGHLHFYRYDPGYADILLLSHDDDGELRKDDQWRLCYGDPAATLREYAYQHPWDVRKEIHDHDYRSLPDPDYRPDLNESLGGTVLLDGGRYVVPLRASFGTATQILDHEATPEDYYLDDRPHSVDLAPADALEKYQIRPTLRGDTNLTGTRIIDEIAIRDRGSDAIYTTVQIDALAADHFIDQLADVDGVDEPMAAALIDEYVNLRTVSWAITNDTAHLESEYDLDAEDLFTAVGDAGIYRTADSPAAGTLHRPDRVKEDDGQDDADSQETEAAEGVQTEFDDF